MVASAEDSRSGRSLKRFVDEIFEKWEPSISADPIQRLNKKRKLILSERDVASVSIRKITKRIRFGTKGLDGFQEGAVHAAEAGKNVFLTGGAGTGKTFVLAEIISSLKYSGKRVAVTASTGCAAVALGGTTVHSYLGLGYDNSHFVPRKASDLSRRLLTLDVLIIDEISMIDASTFDRLENICSTSRKIPIAKRIQRPFGGLQVILCGDFCQLPPVKKSISERSIPFCFESKAWKKCNFSTVSLRVPHRQNDFGFSTLLNEMRFGVVSDSTLSLFNSLSSRFSFQRDPSSSEPFTKLFPCRFQVERENNSRLHGLKGSGIRYIAMDRVETSSSKGTVINIDTRLNQLSAPSVLHIKTGCRVLCTKNLNQNLGIVNGSAGEVIGFAKTRYGAGVNKEGLFENYQDYKGNPRSILGEEVFQLSESSARDYVGARTEDGFLCMDVADAAFLPVVRFENGICLTMKMCKWDVNFDNGRVVLSRSQLCLALGWAFSIHKSQGMSIDKVEVDLSRCFDYGQAYVALSRAKSIYGLRVKGFCKRFVKVHPKVFDFYKHDPAFKDYISKSRI